MMRENGALPHAAGMEAVGLFPSSGRQMKEVGEVGDVTLGSLLSYLSC